MRAFERRQNGVAINLKFLTRGIAALFLFVIMVVTVRGAWDMYGRFSAASVESSAAALELASLEEREVEVAKEVESLSSSRGVEAQIRERYGVARPGEGKIEIVRNNPVDEGITPNEKGNLFMRIIQALFVW